MMRLVFTAILSYVAAAPLTTRISIDISKTDWASAWTYIIWSGSLLIWSIIIIFVVAIILAFFEK